MKNALQPKKKKPLIPLKNRFYKTIKRIFDIVLSSVALIVLSPILIFLAILIKSEDNGPVLFKQNRSGINNNSFEIYKFRSMKAIKPSNKKTGSSYQWINGVPDDFVFKTTETVNSNVTKIGSFIRKYSLDELPQFINVLKGEMSLVGPRPEIIEITRCYNDLQLNRLAVKPGITGWAQVNGRSNSNHGEKIKNDLFYIKNQSFLLDFKILLLTIYQSVFGRDAI